MPCLMTRKKTGYLAAHTLYMSDGHAHPMYESDIRATYGQLADASARVCLHNCVCGLGSPSFVWSPA